MENRSLQDQEIEAIRAEYYRLSAEADKRYIEKQQEFIQEIQNIPVKEPHDNPQRVETETLFYDIQDFVSQQFTVINKMGKKANGFTMEMSLIHQALIAMLKAIKAAFEEKINEFDMYAQKEIENTLEQAKANILQKHPTSTNFDFYNSPIAKTMQARRQKRTELLYSDWLGLIDWQIEIVQAWLRFNDQDPNTLFNMIEKRNNKLKVEIRRLDFEYYKNSEKELIQQKTAPVATLIKRDTHERKIFGYDTEQAELNLQHIQLLIEAGKETAPAAPPLPSPQQQITLPDNLLQALQQAGFIENAAAKPLKWIKTIRKTKGTILNKRALLDLLCLLEYPDSIIKDKKRLKNTFGVEFKSNHFTDITDSKGNLNRPIKSEYHTDLDTIVKQSKEK
jgi:hypothetical protein